MDDALKARLIGATVLVAAAVLFIPELLSGHKPADATSGPVETGKGMRTYTIELGGAGQGTSATQAGGPAAALAPPPPATLPSPATTPTSSETSETHGTSATTEPQDTGAAATARDVPAGPSPAPGAATAAADKQKPATEPVAKPVGSPPATTPASPPVAAKVQPPAATPTSPTVAASSKSPAPEPSVAIPARGGWAVQVGAFGSTDTANRLVKQLQSAGYKAFVAPVSRSGKALYRVRVGPVADRPAAEAMVGGLKGRGLPATVVAND